MRSLVIIFIISAIHFSLIQAQPLTKSSDEQKLEAADMSFENKDYYNAMKNYQDYYKDNKEPEIAYKIAQLQLKLRDYQRAERSFNRIVNRRRSRKGGGENPFMPQARFEYARILKMNGKYDEAIQQLQLYTSEEEDVEKIEWARMEITGAEMALEMDPEKGMVVENAGPNVNSRHSEYSPLMYSDDKMYFAAIQGKSIITLDGKKDKDYFSKIYTADRQGEDGWTKAKAIEGPNLNREGYHIGNLTISPDRRLMFFTRARLQGLELIESKLYLSSFGPDGWSPAKEVEGINGNYIVKQPTIGKLFGNEVMFFVSNMSGGYGGYDIYYSTRAGESFTPPKNLGEAINTKFDEETPYYLDGKLFFSSTGYPGFGGFDIFSSVWNGSNWSAPQNIGKPYNSSVDDLYFSIDKDGFFGLLASNRSGTNSVLGNTCCNDIYTVRKEKIALDLLAKTFSDDGQPLHGVKLQLVQMLKDQKGVTDTRSKEKSNEYSFQLKRNLAYRVLAAKEGYFTDSLDFNTVGLKKSQTIEKKLRLKKVPKKEPEYITITTEQPIRLNNIYYDFDDTKILTDAEKDLGFLLKLMNDYPDMVIELSSHTDARGTKSYNQNLSQRRAESAKNWLVERGIAEERIKPVGYGEAKILNRCVNGVRCSDEEHRFNRRTEFAILSGPTSIKIEKQQLKSIDGSEDSGQKKNK